MKKIFALILMSLAVCVKANAETNIGWSNIRIDNEDTNRYIDSNGNAFWCACMDDDIYIIGISKAKGVFNYNSHAVIGFYVNDTLMEINHMSFTLDGSLMFPDYNLKSNIYCSSKICYHLKHIGEVRICLTSKDFDITIPMNPNLVTYTPKEKPQPTDDIWKSLDTLEVFKQPTSEEILEDLKKTIAESSPIKIETPTPKIDKVWEEYERITKYAFYYNENSIENTYHKIENLIITNKKEMRKVQKKSAEYQLKKLQTEEMKSQLVKLDAKYFEMTGRYIYHQES